MTQHLKTLLIPLFFILQLGDINAQDAEINISFNNLSSLQAIQKIVKSLGYELTLGNIETSDARYSRSYKAEKLSQILIDLTENERIGYTIKNRRVILFKKRLKSDIPPKKHTISGYIYDEDTGEALIGANIYSITDGMGTATNLYGFYSISIYEGEKILQLSYVGYKGDEVNISLNQNIKANHILALSADLETVVITGDKIEKIENQTKMSSITVPVKELNTLPVVGGEVDIIKTLQLMPGVQSGNEGFAGLYVRGGGADQNLIMLDGVPIYNASHLFGIFSVFNADAIKSAELIKGGYPARYGGRLSSILDIRMKEGNMKEWKGQGSVGLISSKLTVEGPLIKDKMSLMISARRTYADIIAKPFIRKARKKKGEEGVPGYYFLDFNAKTNYRISDSDRLYLSFYSGSDKFSDNIMRKSTTIQGGQASLFESEENSRLNWGNAIAALRWNHVYTSKLFSNTTLTSTKYKFNVGFDHRTTTESEIDKKENTELYKYNSDVSDLTAKIDFDYIYSPSQTIKFGSEVVKHQFIPGVTAVLEENININKDTINEGKAVNAIKLMAYAEDEIRLGSRLMVNLGVNASMFKVGNKTYRNIEPRILANFKIATSWSIKGSYTEMTQYLHLLTNSGIGLPTDLWLPPTEKVRPQNSWQGVLGVAHTTNSGIEISVESYYKKMTNLITYKEGASFLQTNNDWESKVASGTGWSYGGEFFIKKNFGKTRGWIGYTLSKSDRQFEEINFGKKYPFKFDRRHDFSVVINHKLSDKMTFGANWVFSSGAAITLPRREFDVGNSYYFGGGYDYGTKNSFRQKGYHRLDLSLSYHKKSSWGEHSFHIDVYNAYSRRNTFYLKLEYDYDIEREFPQEVLKEVTLLPIIPSFRWDFKF